MQGPEGPCEQSRRALAERSKTWVDWARGTVPAPVRLWSVKRVSRGPAQRVQNQQSIHCIVPQSPPPQFAGEKRDCGRGLVAGEGSRGSVWFQSPGYELVLNALLHLKEGLRLSDTPAGSQEGLAEREGGKIAHVCVFKIYKRQALLKFPEPLLKFK